MTVDHGTITPANGPVGSTRGNHIIQGWAAVVDEAARAVLTVLATDLGRVVRQTAGLRPGYYISDTTGTGLDKWQYIGSVSFVLITATFATSQNNYNPTGFAEASHVRLDPTATGLSITGLQAPAVGDTHVKGLVNITANPVQLPNQDVLSLVANRFALPGGADFFVGPGESAVVFYDTVSLRYRIQ